MVTTPQSLFAVEKTVKPAMFGDSQDTPLRLWLPPLHVAAAEETVTSDEPVADDVSGEEEVAAAPADFDELLAAALAEQKTALEAEFAERLEAEKAAVMEVASETATEQVETAATRIAESIASLSAIKLTLAREYRQDAVTLAMTLARAVIGHTLSTNPDALGVIVERAIANTPPHSELVVRCNPDDKAALEQIMPELRTATGDPIAYRVTDAADMERGGIQIDFSDGSIDARPSTALEVLEEAVRGALAGPIDIDAFEKADGEDD